MSQPRRFLLNLPLPDYSYVPGKWPHPHHQPGQRSLEWDNGIVVNEIDWRSCEPYLFGVDLWNHGFYWEAHEAWECPWRQAGRKGAKADFFKALIQLAVAGVKVREGRPQSVTDHARRASELLRKVSSEQEKRIWFGLDLQDLGFKAEQIAENPPIDTESPPARVRVVFPFHLHPDIAPG